MAHDRTSQFWQAELRRVMHKKPAAPSVKARPMPVRPETLDHIPLERRVAMTIRDGIYQSDCARTRSLDKPRLRRNNESGRVRHRDGAKRGHAAMSEATRRRNYPPGFGAVPIELQTIDSKHHVATDCFPIYALFARELIDDTRVPLSRPSRRWRRHPPRSRQRERCLRSRRRDTQRRLDFELRI
jgi:hypothetical protein